MVERSYGRRAYAVRVVHADTMDEVRHKEHVRQDVLCVMARPYHGACLATCHRPQRQARGHGCSWSNSATCKPFNLAVWVLYGIVHCCSCKLPRAQIASYNGHAWIRPRQQLFMLWL
jgi:hypothetical protein